MNNNSIADETTPTQFFLSQNYPNPFREKTVIKYCVPLKTKVHIAIYNAEGEMLKVLVNEIKNPGTYEVEFSALSGSASGGNAAACHSRESGNLKGEIYHYHFEAGDYKIVKKMQLQK